MLCTFRKRNDNPAVEAPGPKQGRVEHVRPVGGGDQDDPFIALETVHLDQELVQGLLPFVVTAAQAGAPMPPHRVNLVDEDDAGGVFFPLLEQVADPRGPDAHEHFNKIRAADGEKRD